jgi:elongation factor Ts
MANVTAADVKRLRDMTQCGMLDCKKALIECDGNFDGAIELLRKKAGAKADKKAGRETNEGLTASVIKGNIGVLVQVSCETDFVAKTDRFIEFVEKLATDLIDRADSGDITEAAANDSAQELKELIGTIGENMTILKAYRWVSNGAVANYLHSGGRIGVMVDVEGEYTDDLLKDLCMHIASLSPIYVGPEDVPADEITKEREIAAEKHQNKPADIVNKILDGHINKWYSDICLTKQEWFKGDKTTLEKIAPKLKVKRFARLQAGS